MHDNFGVGAKVSTLPWNPAGVVVVSYKNGRGSMIWIRYEPNAREFELVPFEASDGGMACAVEPAVYGGIDWAAVAPAWVREHGTVVVLLGSEEYPDTALGDPRASEGKPGGLADYRDARFWHLNGVDVRVVESPGRARDRLPRPPAARAAEPRPVVIRVRGARRHLTGPAARGTLTLAAGRVTARWYLLRAGGPPGDHSRPRGSIAVKYKDEPYHVTADKTVFRAFGVVEAAVQHALTVVLEPRHYDPAGGGWGVYPDQSRNRLLFTGGGERGGDGPLADWGAEFAAKMQKAVRDALDDARADADAAGDDYRLRLRDRFAARWRVKGLRVYPGSYACFCGVFRGYMKAA